MPETTLIVSSLAKRLRQSLISPAAIILSVGAAMAQQPGGGMPPPAVTVVTVQPQSATLSAILPGRVKASATAEVRPQVAGIITSRHFTEGSAVTKGDLLYTIDSATYDAAVKQAEASVVAAQAQLAATKRDETRVTELKTRGVGTQQAVDDAQTAREKAEADVLVAEAQLKVAQIEMDRTSIHARLSGEIGVSEVSEGALVTASQTSALSVIRNIDPVYVDVTQSAADVLRLRRNGGAAATKALDKTVKLKLADGSYFEQTGQLTAAEPHVDEQTGVVVLRLSFANPDKLLLPGMYVQVEMPTSTAEGVYLVPHEGVSRDRRGRPIAMVVNAENMVESRSLDVLQDQGNAWIVQAGLNPGDRVVVAGLQKIGVGAPVRAQERPEGTIGAAPAGPPPGAPPGAPKQ